MTSRSDSHGNRIKIDWIVDMVGCISVVTGTDVGADELAERYIKTIGPGLQFIPSDVQLTEFIKAPYTNDSDLFTAWREANARVQAVKQ
ncbi:hypothetical protein N825_10925 [Skermanella stibiiresistens SB22]|uniref:Uncharacterized protein n=1 Tax=Skermanella stibiiresistens SB22 TaxID=1385369 RepID=W9H4W4_9PROT|nr:hypothetical protein N825_10925 [Skermanella stibiiresistens SB22]